MLFWFCQILDMRFKKKKKKIGSESLENFGWLIIDCGKDFEKEQLFIMFIQENIKKKRKENKKILINFYDLFNYMVYMASFHCTN